MINDPLLAFPCVFEEYEAAEEQIVLQTQSYMGRVSKHDWQSCRLPLLRVDQCGDIIILPRANFKIHLKLIFIRLKTLQGG